MHQLWPEDVLGVPIVGVVVGVVYGVVVGVVTGVLIGVGLEYIGVGTVEVGLE